VKPEGGSNRAITQVKVLSHEIQLITEAEALQYEESSMAKTAKGEVLATPSGSKAMAREHKESVGTGETLEAPERGM
jgi:hypothetical protein